MSESVNQISAADLQKINEYLEEIEKNLLNYHSQKETTEIILIIREQIFQQIELQAAMGIDLNTDKIINRVRSDNEALVMGKDRDEVIFTIGRPQIKKSKFSFTEFLTRKSTAEETENKNENLHQDSLEFAIHQSNEFSRLYLLPLTLVFGITSFLPENIIPSVSILFYGIFLLLSWFAVSNLSSTYLLTQIFFGIFIANISVEIFPYDDIIASVVLIFIPLFCSVTAYKFLKAGFIDPEFNERKFASKFPIFALITLSFSTVLYIFLGIAMNMRGDEKVYYVSVTYAVLILVLRPSFRERIDKSIITITKRIEIRKNTTKQTLKSVSNQNIDPSKTQSTTEIDMQPEIDIGSKKKNESIYQKNETNSNKFSKLATIKNIENSAIEQLTFFGKGMDQNRVTLNVDQERAIRLIKFKKFTLFRFLVLVGVVVMFSYALFFFSLTDVYSINYQIELIGYREELYLENPWIFRNNAILVFVALGTTLVAVLILLFVIEIIRYLNRRQVRKIVNHLVLRQGSITVSSLSTVPPNVDPIKYYNTLGEYVLKGVISIEHEGGQT